MMAVKRNEYRSRSMERFPDGLHPNPDELFGGRAIRGILVFIDPIEQQRGLCVGLNLEQVRRVLAGWTDHPIRGASMPGKGVYFSLWDFVPPSGANVSTIRLTFGDDRLLLWGEPSNNR